MFGLGVSGFLIARAAGLGNNSIWIALVLSTIGFALSIVVTMRVGRRYEKLPTQQKN
jgi:Na+-driven multidrug efflux pump